ncbi:MAG: hypothetical protein ACREQZ_02130 [Woeseiaceae bacterium]
MIRIFWLFFTAIAFATSAVAQDDQAVAEDAQEVPAETGDGATEDTADDADLDEQTYEDDDDDFVPTEEIPADEAIPFPSNI